MINILETVSNTSVSLQQVYWGSMFTVTVLAGGGTEARMAHDFVNDEIRGKVPHPPWRLHWKAWGGHTGLNGEEWMI